MCDPTSIHAVVCCVSMICVCGSLALQVDDTDARMYQLKNMAGEKTNTYTFYVGKVRGGWEGFCEGFVWPSGW